MAKNNMFAKLANNIDEDLNELQMPTGALTPKQFNSSLVPATKTAIALNDLFMIPIDELIPFQRKGDRDFSPWSEDEVKALAEQMDNEGAFEPILVRKLDSGKYEILAGEHRAKASKLKGLKKIRAIVYRGCSDEKAMDIFLLTNLHRRATKISDSIYGWYMFSKNHPSIKNNKDLESAIKVTDSVGTDKMPVTLTQYYRYIKMANLLDTLIEALDKREISLRVGYELALYTHDEQKMFIPVLSMLTEEKLQNIKKHVKEQNLTLSTELIKDLLKPKKTNNYDSSLRSGLAKVKLTIKSKIKPEYYNDINDIINNALDEYLKNNPIYKNVD